MQGWVVGEGQPAGGGGAGFLKLASKSLFCTEDVVVEVKVSQKAAAAMNRIPGIIGEVVGDSAALFLDLVHHRGMKRQYPCDENQFGAQCADLIE